MPGIVTGAAIAIHRRLMRAQQSIRVLLVEGDSLVAAHLTAIITREGWIVSHVCDGRTGLALALEGGFEMVLLDQDLPDGLLGTDVITALRDNGQKAPIVLFTGVPNCETAFQAGRVGANYYLPRTIVSRVLIDVIKELVESDPLKTPRFRTSDPSNTVREGYVRWTKAMTTAIEASEDPRTLDMWASCCHVSAATIRGWCYAIGLQSHGSLVLARLLRAICKASKLGGRARDFLDIADRRTIAQWLNSARLEGADLDSMSPLHLLRQQQLIRDPTAVRELEKSLRQ
jgi:CheY-like chemotaxis protein